MDLPKQSLWSFRYRKRFEEHLRQCTNLRQYRELQNLLHKSPWVARVIWTASLDEEHILNQIDWDDWQLIKTSKVYETSKYQIELVSVILDSESSARNPPPGRSSIRHLISNPGVTCTNIFNSKLNFVTEFLMWLAFMIVSFHLSCSLKEYQVAYRPERSDRNSIQ